jgi:DNA polymerase-3 subunit beta
LQRKKKKETMRFTISSNDLSKTLNLAAGSLGSSSLIHILEDFLLDLKDNKIKVVATNMETAITTFMDVESSDEGTAAVPGRLLLDTLKALPNQPVELFFDEENQTLAIEAAFGKYKMAFDRSGDYPTVPKPTEDDEVVIPSAVLQNVLSHTIIALSSDEIRLAMTGLFVQVDFDKLIFVSTDAHRLVKYTYGNVTTNVSTSFIIPKKGLLLLKAILPDKTDIRMSFDRSFVFFSWGNTTVSCRLVEAQFPDYNLAIPAANPYNLRVSREALIQSLKRILIFANKTTNQIVMDVTDGSLTITARDLDYSNEATEQMPCSFDGEPMTISYNGRFLFELINVLKDENIRFELMAPNKAGLIFPEEQDEYEDLLMLIMPVMVSR